MSFLGLAASRRHAAILAPLLVALVASGCPTRDQLIPGDGGGDQSDGPDPGISIVSPVSMSYVTGTVQVEARVVGGTTDVVQLFRDGMLWQELFGPPPFVYSWGTEGTPHGDYILSAKATVGGQAVTSEPVAVHVDHMQPQVTQVIPTRGNLLVRLRDAITVTFSEPVAPASVSNASVQLGADGTGVASTVVLAADALSLTVTITNPKSLSLPADITASVSTAITDRAGNSLVPLDPEWKWTVPAWISLPPIMSELPPRLAVDGSQRPVMIYVTLDNIGGDNVNTVRVARFENGEWNTAMGAPSAAKGTADHGYSLTLDSGGRPVTAWTETGAGHRDIHVGTWTGSIWNTQFPPLSGVSGAGTDATMPSVPLDGSSRPVVAWRQLTGTAGPTYDAFAARWNGSAWTQLSGSGFMGGAGFSQLLDGPQLALDRQGNPLFGWREGGGVGAGIALWTGTTWSRTQALTGAFTPYPVVDSTGAALAAAMGTDLHVFKWDATIPNWTEPLAPLMTSTSWTGPRLALAPDGSAVVAWLDTTSGVRIGVARWTGSTWDKRFGLFNAGQSVNTAGVELVVDGNGNIWVAWKEGTTAQVWMSNQ